ncbi:hypothetical protein K443DRAFT_2913 [Laccaria amethystina LaAM-08-1]|uniref:Zn(2)-C6 fungal-type domain-containing protein n=1 Tax=Laccaria amethystina LaAM-08-1 TaxID=1095629 RepID=A0A0C9XNL6_9AGAR|nr:hypothetical protein K443DRAFT_2913 [Laccaria amethystina LaAM-08-1]
MSTTPTFFFTPETIMTSPPSNAKTLKKRVSIACVKCRDRKVKCIPAPGQEHRLCTRCLEKNHECQYMTVSAQSEQRGSLTKQEQTDYYPDCESSPPPATPVYSQPPPLGSTYSYTQQPFPNQPYQTSAHQIADHQNTPPISFSPPSNMSSAHQAFYPPPRQPVPYAQPSLPIRSGQDTSGNYGTHGYFDPTYPAQPMHQMPMNQQYYPNPQWHQGGN